jgi:glycosyltransferase involved in cell wall biosynthesis
MRLAYLLKKFPRLSETFVLNEVLGQEALGAQIHVFSRRAPDEEPRQPQLASLRASVDVLPASGEIDPWRELFAQDETAEAGQQLLVRVRAVLDGLRPLAPARLPSLMAEALWLRRRTRELGLDHVHVHFATDSAISAMILHRLGGPTYSITAHAKDIYRSTVDPRLLHELVAGSEFTVTVCDANVEHLRRMLGARAIARVRRLYNGVDLDAFRADGGVRRSDRILSVGRLVEKKGFDVLVDALALLAERGVEFSADLVGDGEDREAIRARIDARGLASRVHLTGPLDQVEIRRRMLESTLLCLPCKIGADGNRDALPTVLLEAQAAGLPSISTPVSGIPEILDGGRAGVLVPENDPAATARAMCELLEDAPRRAELARAGRRRAEELFDGRNAARTLHEWFTALPPRAPDPAATAARLSQDLTGALSGDAR